jgi:hypothetical protein
MWATGWAARPPLGTWIAGRGVVRAVGRAAPRALRLTVSRVLLSLVIVVALATDGLAARRGGFADTTSLVPVGGVLRKGTGAWRVYDPHHAHTGIGELSCWSNGILHVDLDPDGVQTGFGAATVDEHLAGDGITVGVSASLGELRLYFFRGGRRTSCDSAPFSDDHANVWLSWTQVLAVAS